MITRSSLRTVSKASTSTKHKSRTPKVSRSDITKPNKSLTVSETSPYFIGGAYKDSRKLSKVKFRMGLNTTKNDELDSLKKTTRSSISKKNLMKHGHGTQTHEHISIGYETFDDGIDSIAHYHNSKKDVKCDIMDIGTKSKNMLYINVKQEPLGFENVPASNSKLGSVKPSVNVGSVWMPVNWKLHLDNIHNMRSKRDAAVDTMGCDQISDKSQEPSVYRYQVLLSLMLSSQTRDEITSSAMLKLQSHGCTIENIIKTSDLKLCELIYPVGFYKRKVEYIKKSSQILRDKYGNDIPRTVEELCKLPGVGPKMAHLVMKSAWNEISGIGVDTHVHRISNRLQWTRHPTTNPEKTRIALEEWLPREYWEDINMLLVGFGQQICLPVGPKCSICLNKDTCNVGKKSKQNK